MRVTDVLDQILIEKHSSEIEEIVEGLPSDNLEACKQFCKQFDFLADNPQWLINALADNDKHLVDLLDDVIFDRRMAEREAGIQQADILYDLRATGN